MRMTIVSNVQVPLIKCLWSIGRTHPVSCCCSSSPFILGLKILQDYYNGKQLVQHRLGQNMAKYLQIPLSIIYKCETCMLSIKHSCFRYFGNMFSYHILAQRWQLSQFILSSVSIHNIDEHMKGEGGVSSGKL